MNSLNEVVLELPEMTKPVWKSKGGNHCATIRGHLALGLDGRDYLSVLDTQTGLPVDEL